jgi:hypothetical protein
MEKIVKADAARPSSPSLEGELDALLEGFIKHKKRFIIFLECTQ